MNNLVISLSGSTIGKTTIFNRMQRLTKKDENIIYVPRINKRNLFGSNISYRELFRNGAPGQYIQRIFINTYKNIVVGHTNKVIICNRFLTDILALYRYFQIEFYDSYFINLNDMFKKSNINFLTILLRNEKYEDIPLSNCLIDVLDDNNLEYINHTYQYRNSEERIIQEVDKASFAILTEISKRRRQ